jgi:rhamnopyranosyl-N-acetylglucosaminyl-diphospho-decaprenol beta-1,3/1,4-galactofuranosyltransferase
VIKVPHNEGGALGFESGMRHVTAQYDPDWMVLMDDDGRPRSAAIARFQKGIIERRWLEAEAK